MLAEKHSVMMFMGRNLEDRKHKTYMMVLIVWCFTARKFIIKIKHIFLWIISCETSDNEIMLDFIYKFACRKRLTTQSGSVTSQESLYHPQGWQNWQFSFQSQINCFGCILHLLVQPNFDFGGHLPKISFCLISLDKNRHCWIGTLFVIRQLNLKVCMWTHGLQYTIVFEQRVLLFCIETIKGWECIVIYYWRTQYIPLHCADPTYTSILAWIFFNAHTIHLQSQSNCDMDIVTTGALHLQDLAVQSYGLGGLPLALQADDTLGAVLKNLRLCKMIELETVQSQVKRTRLHHSSLLKSRLNSMSNPFQTAPTRQKITMFMLGEDHKVTRSRRRQDKRMLTHAALEPYPEQIGYVANSTICALDFILRGNFQRFNVAFLTYRKILKWWLWRYCYACPLWWPASPKRSVNITQASNFAV